MDNMLYIIAGLIIILVIGVWILRRNKAQRPPNRAIRQDSLASAIVPTNHAAGTSVSTATMFDDITVAQRFIDQQRYDKAIETLERGLSQKPNDSALSLKLLNVYALSNNKEAFYGTYAAITTHADTATIAQAKQLKALLDEDHHMQASTSFDPAAQHKADMALTGTNIPAAIDIANPVSASSNSGTTNNEMSLDFDFPSSTPSCNNDLAVTSPTDTDTKGLDSIPSHSFDLTLDDLEATDEIPIKAIELEPVFLLETENNTDVLDSDVLNSVVTQSPDKVVNSETVITDELLLDFDNVENTHESQSIADSAVTNKADVYNEGDFELDFDNLLDDSISKESQTEQGDILSTDDFVLNLDESSVLDNQSSTLDIDSKSSVDSNLESVDDDFLLFLDEVTDSDSNSLDETAEKSEIEIPDFFANSQPPSIADNVFELDTLDSVILEHITDKSQAPEITLSLSDDSDIEAFDFNIDAPEQVSEPSIELPATDSVSSPVPLNDAKDTDLSASFAAQFAADFEFVDTLDSQQITLDLAAQYLQLGEYDSANRLLNEVIVQGNPEQQQQAQALLARSA